MKKTLTVSMEYWAYVYGDQNSNYGILSVLLHRFKCFNITKDVYSFSLPFFLQSSYPETLVAAFKAKCSYPCCLVLLHF